MVQRNWGRGGRRHLLVGNGTVEIVIRQVLAKALKTKQKRERKGREEESTSRVWAKELSELQLNWDIQQALHCQPGTICLFVLASCVSATTQVLHLPLHLMWPALQGGCESLEKHRAEFKQWGHFHFRSHLHLAVSFCQLYLACL